MSETVLSVLGLTRHYTVRRRWLGKADILMALNSVSFTLKTGHTLGIVGESGCGKSTLARQLTMIEIPTSGVITIDGINVNQADRKTIKSLRRKVQMVFQNPYASLNPRQKIGKQLAEPLLIQDRLGKKDREDRVREMMQKVGLKDEHFHRYPHMFSGGQLQRIAIARTMMLKPKIIVADEPTSALDVSIQAQILNLFMDLQDEYGIAYVFISHNLSVVERMADDVVVMYLGKIVEKADNFDLFNHPLHPYTRILLSATPSLNPDKNHVRIPVKGELPSPFSLPVGCAFRQRCPYAIAHCAEEEPPLREVAYHLVACHRAEELT